MRPQETRRIVLGTSLAAVAAACVPGLPERRPEDNWPVFRPQRSPEVSFRYNPEWTALEEFGYIYFETTLGQKPHIKAQTVISVDAVDSILYFIDVTVATLEEAKVILRSGRERRRHIEDITVGGSRWKGIRVTDAWDPIKREVLFTAENKLYIAQLHCQVDYHDGPIPRGLGLTTHLEKYPEDMGEVMRLRDKALSAFGYTLNTVQIRKH